MRDTATITASSQREAAAFDDLLKDLSLNFVISNPREPDNPIVYASQSFLEFTQYSHEEVLGKNCRFLQGPTTSRQAIMEIRDAIREDRPCTSCLLNFKKDGTPFWNAFHLSPILGNDGGIIYYIGIQADVTKLVEDAARIKEISGKLEEEEKLAMEISRRVLSHERDLMEKQPATACGADKGLPSSIICSLGRLQSSNFVLVDPNLPDLPMVYCSAGFLRMTGYSCAEMIGRNCRLLQGPGTDRAEVAKIAEAISALPPRPVTVTLLNYKKHGEPFWNCVHIASVRNAEGKVQFFVGVQVDVTHGKELGRAAATEGQGVVLEASSNGGPEHLAKCKHEATVMDRLHQKGIVGAVRVVTRSLGSHGLRRVPSDDDAGGVGGGLAPK